MGPLSEDFLRYLAPTSLDPPVIEVISAEGSWVTAVGGRRYLDWLAGIGVASLGHRHPAVLASIRAQLESHLHVMVYGDYAQSAQVDLAKELCRLAPFGHAKAYLTSTGTEAVEGALKLARKKTGRGKLAAFEMAYHGATSGSLSLMGSDAMRAPFEPMLECEHLPFGNSAALKRIDKTVAAVFVEPIQAEGGVRVPPDDFLANLRKRCDETGSLLVFDEIQTGLGRTGRFWALDHANVTPDVLVLAKALGGGLPLGAFLAAGNLMDELSRNPPLSHLTTFGGNPVSCAAGLAALRVTVEQDLAGAAARSGTALVRTLSELKARGQIVDVRGRGLLIGVELENEKRASAVVDGCRESGLLLGCALLDPRVIRLTPPLNMAGEELDTGIRILSGVLRSLS